MIGFHSLAGRRGGGLGISGSYESMSYVWDDGWVFLWARKGAWSGKEDLLCCDWVLEEIGHLIIVFVYLH